MSISKTFCPAKWDEILVNLSANYVYSCCKSVPIKITKKEDIEHALNQQRKNLLDGIQDPACNYCWQVENTGHKSRRHQYLNVFDQSKFDEYKNNTVVLKKIEISLGNECNFQCIYCNPKFSSQWESDVKFKSYKIYSDRYFYKADEKNKNNISDTLKWLKNYDDLEMLEIIGGEPLQNKNFFKVINSTNSRKLGFTTNLSCKKKVIDKILDLSNKYTLIEFKVSLDSTGENAEFSRYGLDFNNILDNLNYIFENIPNNIVISINSLMTSLTIRDISNMIKLMDKIYKKYPGIIWNIYFCRDPNILTLNTLPDELKPYILSELDTLSQKSYKINGVESLKGAIIKSKFNQTLYKQMKHFLTEFSDRKNIIIPFEL